MVILKRWYWEREWFSFKSRIISSVIGCDAGLIGSEISTLQADIHCLQGRHKWQDWSATMCGNVDEIQALRDKAYAYRACRHCRIEMPESRIYGDGRRDKDSITFDEWKVINF